MKKKRKARQKARQTSAIVADQGQKQVRAISSFRGSQPTDLEFVVGDTITVLAKVRSLRFLRNMKDLFFT